MGADSAPIKLKTAMLREPKIVMLERYVDLGGGNVVRKKVPVPIIGDEQCPELACRVYKEFMDLVPNDRFRLTTGASRFKVFRLMLRGAARDSWDTLKDSAPGTAIADFEACIGDWIDAYFEPSAYVDTKEYLATCTKAFSMTVKQTVARVKKIISYMELMPGGMADPYDAVEIKQMIHRMMREDWKNKFMTSGSDLNDPNYSLEQLTRFMTVMEQAERSRHNAAERGGRGSSGRGQSSPGRGSAGGRGFGRGRYQGRWQGSEYSGGRYSGQVRQYDGGYNGYGSNYGPPSQRSRYNSYRAPQGRGYYGGQGSYRGGYSSQYHGRGGYGRGSYGRDGGRGRSASAGRDASGRGRGTNAGRTNAYYGDHYGVESEEAKAAEEEVEAVGASFDSGEDFQVEHYFEETGPYEGEYHDDEEVDYGYGDY